MPAISSFNYQGPLAFSDRLIGVFGGATNGVSLQQFRDFFGVGTNWVMVASYPTTDQANPIYGKNGDVILCLDTNHFYRKAANAFPPVDQPSGKLQGTKVNDTVIAGDTSWSSQKIDQFIRGAVAVALDLAPNASRRVPFLTKVLLETLRVTFGTDSLTTRLLLADGTAVSTASGTGAACIGQMSVSINNLTAAQVAAGYNVEITNTSAGQLTALLRTIPLT